MHLRKLQYRKFKIRQVGLVKTNTDMVKEAFDKTLVEHKRLLGKKPGFFGSWATLDMSQSHACITRFCFNYWCFNPGLTKQQAYEGACKVGILGCTTTEEFMVCVLGDYSMQFCLASSSMFKIVSLKNWDRPLEPH